MDNLCHTLAGAALSRAGLGGRTRYGPTALLAGANLPDLDVLVFATGHSAVAFRRGWTHGVLAQAALPVLLAGALWLLARRRPSAPPDTVRPVWLLVLSSVGVLSHVGLDYLNTYGVRLLAPLDWRWFYGDAVFIIDPWLWLVLGAGTWLAGRYGSVRPARVALATALCYIAAMVVSTHVARAAVLEAWREAGGGTPRAVMVGPVPVWPLTRDVIVDAGEAYVVGQFTFPARTTFSPEPIRKNATGPPVAAASRDAQVRGFLVWSRFPHWTLEPDGDGAVRATVGDMRFRLRGGDRFRVSAVVPSD